jgi:Zn-finger nucleic acid-binding protein
MTSSSWCCPNCKNAMIRGNSVIVNHWHCPACQFDWVQGESLAAFLPTVRAFTKLRESAEAGKRPTRALECPSCRAPTMRVVPIGGAEIDVCHKCASIALDPGEMPALKSLGHSKVQSTANTFDVVEAIEVVLSLLH